MAKNPIMVAAGKKAAATRRKNREAQHQVMVAAGKKAWETRRKNQSRNASPEKRSSSVKTFDLATANQILQPLGLKIVKA